MVRKALSLSTIIVPVIQVIFAENYKQKELIGQLTAHFKFDHNIFVFSPSLLVNSTEYFLNTSDFTPRSWLTLNTTQIRQDENFTDDIKIESNHAFMIVVPEIADFDSNFTIMSEVKVIQRRQIHMKIGIFLANVTPTENLLKFFDWCKRELIVNIFVASFRHDNDDSSLNIFSFHPFGLLTVINVTEHRNESIFPSLDSNFHQHNLRLTVKRQNSLNIRFWNIVVSAMNASSKFRVMANSSSLDRLGIDFDIHPNLCTQDELKFANVYSFKIGLAKLLVPQSMPYSGFTAYLIAMTSDAFFSYIIILVVGMILLLSAIRYIIGKKLKFFETVADVLNLLINDNSRIKYSTLARSEMFLIVPLTFVGLIVVNSTLSNLKSYLTRPFYRPQIKTAQDIHASNLPILVWQKGWKDVVISALESHTDFTDWNDRVVVLNVTTWRSETLEYNRFASLVAEPSQRTSKRPKTVKHKWLLRHSDRSFNFPILIPCR